MNREDLHLYPAIEQAFVAVGCPALTGSFIEWLHDSDGGRNSIRTVERCLDTLFHARSVPVLNEQLRAILGNMRAWQKALTELLGLSHFEERHLLADVGWPTIPGVDTPPFDGTITDSPAGQVQLPFDIKPALGGGIALLEDQLQREVDRWVAARHLSAHQVGIHYRGAVTQEIVGDSVPGVLFEFRGKLNEHSATPEEPITLTLGDGTTIEITIELESGVIIHSGTARVCDQAELLGETVRGHILDKLEQAVRHGGSFLLVYVRPFGAGGSDLDARKLGQVIGDALRDTGFMNQPELDRWIGVILLDWTSSPGSPQAYGHLRQEARWPVGFNIETLTASLALTPLLLK